MSERKAEIAHEIWSHWMKYMFSVIQHNNDGSMTITEDKVLRWWRLMETPFSELTEKEKESDFEIAQKYMSDL